MKRGPKPTTDEQKIEKFLARIEKSEDCWWWLGPTNFRGYGHATWGRQNWVAHRLAYKIFKGDFDKTLFVCHSCDNPGCVNPDHLFLGTPKDNTQDSITKGRFVNIQQIKDRKLGAN